jgi:hypothetical protein
MLSLCPTLWHPINAMFGLLGMVEVALNWLALYSPWRLWVAIELAAGARFFFFFF